MKGKFFVFSFLLVFLIFGVSAFCGVNYCEYSEDGKCVLLGDTYDSKYCDFDLEMKDKLEKGESCLNGFECSTETCINDVCSNKYDALAFNGRLSFFDKILGFFNGEDPEVTDDDDDDASGGSSSGGGSSSSSSGGSCVSVYVCGAWSNSLESCGTRVCVDDRCNGPDRTESSVCPGLEGFCGDLICDSDESCSNCEVDCGSCNYCGDDICSDDENNENCPDDCNPKFSYWKVFIVFILILIIALLAVVFFIFSSKKRAAGKPVKIVNSTPKSKPKSSSVIPKDSTLRYPAYGSGAFGKKNRDI